MRFSKSLVAFVFITIAAAAAVPDVAARDVATGGQPDAVDYRHHRHHHHHKGDSSAPPVTETDAVAVHPHARFATIIEAHYH